jgi:preprotein translocase subunit SecE
MFATLTGEQCAMREYVARVTTFLQDVQAETKKVTWPSRRDVMGSTLVVIVAVFVIAGFLGIIDFILSLLIGALIK